MNIFLAVWDMEPFWPTALPRFFGHFHLQNKHYLVNSFTAVIAAVVALWKAPLKCWEIFRFACERGFTRLSVKPVVKGGLGSGRKQKAFERTDCRERGESVTSSCHQWVSAGHSRIVSKGSAEPKEEFNDIKKKKKYLRFHPVLQHGWSTVWWWVPSLCDRLTRRSLPRLFSCLSDYWLVFTLCHGLLFCSVIQAENITLDGKVRFVDLMVCAFSFSNQ